MVPNRGHSGHSHVAAGFNHTAIGTSARARQNSTSPEIFGVSNGIHNRWARQTGEISWAHLGTMFPTWVYPQEVQASQDDRTGDQTSIAQEWSTSHVHYCSWLMPIVVNHDSPSSTTNRPISHNIDTTNETL